MKDKLTITVDEELLKFLKQYAKKNFTTMSAVINQYLAKLYNANNISISDLSDDKTKTNIRE